MTQNKAIRSVAITNAHGLHTRPASEFAKLARGFEAEVQVKTDHVTADGKAVMHLLSLGAVQGVQIVIEACGPDADAAVEALAALVESGFPEAPENDLPSNTVQPTKP